MIRRGTAWTIFCVVAVAFTLGFLWPLVRVISGGLYVDSRFTLRFVAGVFRNPVYAEGLANSLRLAVGTTLLSLLIALPLAWMSHRFDFPGKRAFAGLVLVPMILPPFVGAIGLQQILGQYGALNALLRLGPVDWLGQGRMAGVILLQALGLYPIMYLNATTALANVDPAMEEAAANLGGRGWTRFRRITLPLIMPGVFAGGTIVFIWSFTELGTPLIMNYSRCASVQIYDALKEIGASPFPYALVLVMLVWSILLYTGTKLLFGRSAYAMQGKAVTAYSTIRLRGVAGLCATLPFLLVIGAALLPHVGVVLTSFERAGTWYRTVVPAAFTMENYSEALGHGMTVSGIRNSLLFSSLAVFLDLGLGVAVALVIVRSNIRVRGVLDALAMAPLAVPGLVMAFGYLSISSLLANHAFVKDSTLLTRLFDVGTDPTLFLVTAYAVRRLPYMVRAAVAGLQQTSVVFEESAANLGASPWTALRRVTLPLITANLIAGVLLAFAFCMLEVSDSLMLAQQAEFFPITKAIYELFQLIGTGKYLAAALGVWAMFFLATTLVGASLILGKKLGALFRV